MRYYKVIKSGVLQYIGEGLGGEEITAEEYAALSEKLEKTDLPSVLDSEEAQNVDDDS